MTAADGPLSMDDQAESVAAFLSVRSEATGEARGPDDSMGAAKDLLAIMEAPWANSRTFFADAILLIVVSCVMGVLSCAYMRVVGDATEYWLSRASQYEYPTDPRSFQNLKGPILWLPLCWAGGTVVGILKVVVGLDTYPSFLEDLLHREVDPKTALKVMLCCVASLLTGAAMGPEAGLGAAGGALGSIFARCLCGAVWTPSNHRHYHHDHQSFEPSEASRRERIQLFTLAGMAAAFGSIMPAPWVGLLLVVELSNRKHDPHGKEKITIGNRTVCLLGLVASLAWAVKNMIDPAQTPPLPGGLLDVAYSNWMPLKAIGLGFISVVVVLIYFVIAGVCKRSFLALSRVIQRRVGERFRIIFMCSLAGLLTGCLGVLVPLSLTDGATQIMPTLKSQMPRSNFPNGMLTASDLIAVAFAKCFAYWIAASGGFVGGIFFPLLYIGVVAGELMKHVPGFDTSAGALFTVPVMMASIPASILPMPFTLVALPLSTFNLGPKWCVPIFIATLTSYSLLVGTGLMRRILERAGAREVRADPNGHLDGTTALTVQPQS